MEEKYVTLFLNIEAWNDYKRTCLPALAPAPTALGNTLRGPTRFPVGCPTGSRRSTPTRIRRAYHRWDGMRTIRIRARC